MPPFPSDKVEVERLVRAALAEKFGGIEGLPHVLTHRVWIDSEQQAVRVMSYQHPSTRKTEYRVLTIDFLDFEDTDVGCADNPVFYLVYTLRLSVSHQDSRPDGSTSTDDYARILLTLRERVLREPQLAGYAQLWCAPLKAARGRFGLDDETLIVGHHAAPELRVEVTPA